MENKTVRCKQSYCDVFPPKRRECNYANTKTEKDDFDSSWETLLLTIDIVRIDLGFPLDCIFESSVSQLMSIFYVAYRLAILKFLGKQNV